MLTNENEIVRGLLPLPTAEFQILVALADGPRHGYGILLEIKERTRGSVRLSIGALYAAIKRMQDHRLILEQDAVSEERHPGEKRRYYALTPRGEAVARAELERLESVLHGVRCKLQMARPRPDSGHA